GWMDPSWPPTFFTYTPTLGTPTRCRISEAAASAWALAPWFVLSGLNSHSVPSGAAWTLFAWAPPRVAALPGPNDQPSTSPWSGRGGRSAVMAWWALRAATTCRCLVAKDFGAPPARTAPEESGAELVLTVFGTGLGAAGPTDPPFPAPTAAAIEAWSYFGSQLAAM